MFSIEKLELIKESIESMNKDHQIEILKLLNSDSNVTVSENNNGSFVNLTNLDIKILTKLEDYIEYVNKQQIHLSNIEDKKQNIMNEYFLNDAK